MRLMTRPFPNLQDADIIPYYWEPRFYLRWRMGGRTTWDTEGNPHWNPKIVGIKGRLWPIGFVIHWPNGGRFINGSSWQIFYKYERTDELYGIS